MGGHFGPNRPVYTALFLLLVSAFSRDKDSSCSSKNQSVVVDNVHDVGDTMYKDTLDPGLTSFARHCLCLSGARGFYIPRRRHSSCAVLVALLLIIGEVQPNPGPTAHGNNDGLINLGCVNVRSAVNKSAEIHSIITDHNHDLLAVTETWITSDAPPAIKADIAPQFGQ